MKEGSAIHAPTVETFFSLHQVSDRSGTKTTAAHSSATVSLPIHYNETRRDPTSRDPSKLASDRLGTKAALKSLRKDVTRETITCAKISTSF